jgi:hypothetical protein
MEIRPLAQRYLQRDMRRRDQADAVQIVAVAHGQ